MTGRDRAIVERMQTEHVISVEWDDPGYHLECSCGWDDGNFHRINAMVNAAVHHVTEAVAP